MAEGRFARRTGSCWCPPGDAADCAVSNFGNALRLCGNCSSVRDDVLPGVLPHAASLNLFCSGFRVEVADYFII